MIISRSLQYNTWHEEKGIIILSGLWQ